MADRAQEPIVAWPSGAPAARHLAPVFEKIEARCFSLGLSHSLALPPSRSISFSLSHPPLLAKQSCAQHRRSLPCPPPTQPLQHRHHNMLHHHLLALARFPAGPNQARRLRPPPLPATCCHGQATAVYSWPSLS